MTLNLHLVRLFVAVVDEQSFTRAAATLYISQPAVSRSVQELERQVGLALLDRAHGQITLTEAGTVLYQQAQHIFAAERVADREFEQMRGLQSGRLAIGASTTPGIYLLPPLLAAYQHRFPAIQLFLDIGTTPEILSRLQTTALDVAFVEGPVATNDALVATPWRDDRLVVIASPAHVLAGQHAIPLDRLLAEPCICREPGSGTRAIIDAHLHALGKQLTIGMEVGSTEAMKQLVSAGLGIAITSESAIVAEKAAQHLVVLHVPQWHVRRQLTRVQRSGRSVRRSLSAFLELLDMTGHPANQEQR